VQNHRNVCSLLIAAMGDHQAIYDNLLPADWKNIQNEEDHLFVIARNCYPDGRTPGSRVELEEVIAIPYNNGSKTLANKVMVRLEEASPDTKGDYIVVFGSRCNFPEDDCETCAEREWRSRFWLEGVNGVPDE
jgi:hypothetical protein